MNPEIQWICNELISSFVEGGAQGVLITGLIWGLIKLCPRANAATRHAAWFATLLVVALLPATHFIEALKSRLRDSIDVPTRVVVTPPAHAQELAVEESAAAQDFPAEPSVLQTDMAPEPAVSEPVFTHNFKWKITLPRRLPAILIGGWSILVTIRLIQLVGQLVMLRSIKRRAEAPPEILAESFAGVVASMRIYRRPRLLISQEAAAPMVVGYFHPAMLLPKFIATRSGNDLEHLFRHELAHLARRDDWTNLIQQMIAAVLFFHPGVLFLSRRLTMEREIACDDHALAISRTPREYALFLTEFASQMKGRSFTAAPAAWSSNSQLKERIGMILNGNRNASPRVSRAGVGAITATALTIALLALAATPRFVVAAEELAVEQTAIATSDVTSAVSVETSVEPVVELAIATEVPEIPEQPEAPAKPIVVRPSVSVASITTPPREKLSISVPRINVNANPTPPVKVAFTPQADPAPEPASHPRPKPTPRPDRDDGNIERRLDRLERLVEELKREKRDRSGKEESFFGKPRMSAEAHTEYRAEMENAQREIEHAKHEAERSAREQRQLMQMGVDPDRVAQMAARESLKARRQALESQRKHIDKELEAVEKEIKQQDEKRAEKEREKKNKAEELEKKHRDLGDKPNSDEPKGQ